MYLLTPFSEIFDVFGGDLVIVMQGLSKLSHLQSIVSLVTWEFANEPTKNKNLVNKNLVLFEK